MQLIRFKDHKFEYDKEYNSKTKRKCSVNATAYNCLIKVIFRLLYKAILIDINAKKSCIAK